MEACFLANRIATQETGSNPGFKPQVGGATSIKWISVTANEPFEFSNADYLELAELLCTPIASKRLKGTLVFGKVQQGSKIERILEPRNTLNTRK
jgi:hypothetical protein